MQLLVRIVYSLGLIIVLAFTLFPQLFWAVGGDAPFLYTWETALMRYLLVAASFFLLFYIWKEVNTWKWLFFTSVCVCLCLIFLTPEYTTGSWIYSAPEREEVALFYMYLLTVSFGGLLILRGWSALLVRTGTPTLPNMGRGAFFLRALFVLMLVVLLFLNTLLTEDTLVHTENILLPMLWPYMVGIVVSILSWYFLHIWRLRVLDAQLPKALTILPAVPFLLFLILDFGLYLFVLVSPIYVLMSSVIAVFPTAREKPGDT